MFKKYLKKSIIIPKDFNIQSTVSNIIEDFERLYTLYIKLNDNDYHSAYQFLMYNKNEIKNELEKRFREMTLYQHSIDSKEPESSL